MVSVNNIYASGCTPDSYYYNIIQKKHWKLVQIQRNNESIDFDRFKMSLQGNRKLYTIDLCEKFISGIAAYNEFKAPYVIERPNNNMHIEDFELNLLLPPKEIDGITEDEYFEYLRKINKWKLYRDSLFKKWTFSLIIKEENNDETILVYKY